MNRLKKLWLDLNSSLWFLPDLIVAGSVALALGLVELDKQFGGNWITVIRVFSESSLPVRAVC